MIEFNKKYKYNELCEVTNEKVLDYSSRRPQLRNLSKKYEIEKFGNYYIIRHEYTKDEIQQNEIRGIYIQLFSLILSQILSNSNGNYVCYSMMELLSETKMVNADYKYCRYNIPDVSTILDTDPNQLELYTTKSYLLMSRLVKDMMVALEDKSLILVRKGYRLYKNYADYTETKTIQLNSNEESLILAIEQVSLEEMGETSISDVYRHEAKVNKFKKITQKKCKEIFPAYDGYFGVYHINLNKKGLRKYSQDTYLELNEKIKDKLSSSIILNKIEDLPKLIEATIDLRRPYQIKEKLKKENDIKIDTN